jgi:CheY-like chemotaxis protein/tetratricopeptide (TPR) repeat protein
MAAPPAKPVLTLQHLECAVIVDADNSMLSLIGNYLTKGKVGNCNKFLTGDQAKDFIQNSLCDLLIIDWKMKNPTGLQFYEFVRGMEQYKQLPIVLVSGVVTPNDIQIAQVDRFARFIVKPFAEEVFLTTILKFVGKPGVAVKKPAPAQIPQQVAPAVSSEQTQGAVQSSQSVSIGNKKDSGLQIIKNSSNKKIDGKNDMMIVAGSGNKSGLGLHVDKGQRIAGGTNPQIFDQDQHGLEINARTSKEDLGGDFEAVQKRDQGNEWEMSETEFSGLSDDGTIKNESHDLTFTANQEGPKDGTNLDGTFSRSGVIGQGEDLKMQRASNSGDFNAQQEGARHSDFAGEAGPEARGGSFDGNFGTESKPTGKDMADPRRASSTGQNMRSANRGDSSSTSANQTQGRTSNPWVMEEDAGSPDIPAPEGQPLQNQTPSPAEGSQGPDGLGASSEQQENLNHELGLDGTSPGLETANEGSEVRHVEEPEAPRSDGEAGSDNTQKSAILDESAIPAKDRPRKTLCVSTVMGTKVDVLVPLDVLIVDHDEAQQKLIAQHLTEIGADNVQTLSESPTAWDRIQEQEYDLIIIDWKLRGLSGLALYSRIRENPPTATTPVIVMSGFVHKEDFRLLGESHYTKYLEKPIKKKDFEEVLKDAMTEAATHDKITMMIGNLIDKMNGDSKKIVTLIEGLLKNIANPFIFVLCAGEHLLNKGDLDNAEKVLRIAQKIDPNNVTVITELSKIYHRTGRSDLAIVMLSKANAMSPDSVERLCLMGEIGLTVQDPERARKYFEATLKIDKDHAKAKAGMVLTDNLKDSKIQPAGKSVSSGLASSLNIVAVTLVKNSQFDKAISQYQSAMCFVFDPGTLARLQFNLGMAYLKDKKFEQAHKWFKVAAGNATPEFQKPTGVLEKLERFLSKHQKDGGLSDANLADAFIVENQDLDAENQMKGMKLSAATSPVAGVTGKLAG